MKLLHIKSFINRILEGIKKAKQFYELDCMLTDVLTENNKIIKKLYVNQTVKRAFFEVLEIKDNYVVGSDWVMRYPVWTLARNVRITREAIQDNLLYAHKVAIKKACDDLLHDLKLIYSDDCTYYFREFLTCDIWIDQMTLDIMCSIHLRLVQVPTNPEDAYKGTIPCNKFKLIKGQGEKCQ